MTFQLGRSNFMNFAANFIAVVPKIYGQFELEKQTREDRKFTTELAQVSKR